MYIPALACALIELDKNNVKSGYPQIVKDFSQQVRFYSTAAYEVVRKHFAHPLQRISDGISLWTCLPHESQGTQP